MKNVRGYPFPTCGGAFAVNAWRRMEGRELLGVRDMILVMGWGPPSPEDGLRRGTIHRLRR